MQLKIHQHFTCIPLIRLSPAPFLPQTLEEGPQKWVSGDATRGPGFYANNYNI